MNPVARMLTSEPAYRPGGGWSPMAAVLAVLGTFAVAALAAVLVTTIVDQATVRIERAPYGGGVERPASALLPVLIWLITLQAVLIVLTVVIAGWRGGSRRETLALDPPAGGIWDYGTAMVLLIAVFGLYTAVVLFLKPETVLEDVKPFADMIRSDLWWLALVAVGLGAPISEELIFRGFLFSALARSRLGVGGAAVFTTAAWTSLHAGYSIYGLAEVFAVGLFFSWALWKTGSLRVPIFCHAAYNTTIILALRMIDLPA